MDEKHGSGRLTSGLLADHYLQLHQFHRSFLLVNSLHLYFLFNISSLFLLDPKTCDSAIYLTQNPNLFDIKYQSTMGGYYNLLKMMIQ